MSNSIENLLKSDPILNAFITGKIPTTSGSTLSWIVVPTSDTENLADGNIDLVRAKSDFDKRTSIALYVLKEFNQTESIAIKRELELPGNLFPRIKIDYYGGTTHGQTDTSSPSDLAEKFKGLKLKGKINFTIPQTLNTVESNYIDRNMYSWSSKFFISTSLKYILYYNTNNNKYYLCVNPLHSRGFKEYYKLKIDDINSIDQLMDYGAAFRKNTPEMIAITKYCNAFTLTGKKRVADAEALYNANGPEIYLDPFCGVLIDKNTAALNRYYNTNITSYYYKNRFFKTQKVAKEMVKLITDLYNGSGGSIPFACPVNDISLYSLGNSLGVLSDSTDSFLNEYGNLSINKFTNKSDKFTKNDCGRPNVTNCTVLYIADVVSGSNTTQECGSKSPAVDDFIKKREEALANAGPTDNPPPLTENVVKLPNKLGDSDKNDFLDFFKNLDKTYLVIGIVVIAVILLLLVLFNTSTSASPQMIVVPSK